jgi:hypothetical protein
LKQMREEMHGKYTELTDEKEIIRTSAIMDKHMAVRVFLYCFLTSDSDNVVQALSPKYFNTRALTCHCGKRAVPGGETGAQSLALCRQLVYKGVSKDRYVQWLANVRILCLLTLHAGLSASKNLAMRTA